MDVQHVELPAPTNTEHRSRDRNDATIPARTVFVERDLLQAADFADDSHQYVNSARRLLVTTWLLAGGIHADEEELARGTRAAVAFWNARKLALHDWRRATVTTVLFELEQIHGLVESFETTEGGFLVNVRETQA